MEAVTVSGEVKPLLSPPALLALFSYPCCPWSLWCCTCWLAGPQRLAFGHGWAPVWAWTRSNKP